VFVAVVTAWNRRGSSGSIICTVMCLMIPARSPTPKDAAATVSRAFWFQSAILVGVIALANSAYRDQGLIIGVCCDGSPHAGHRGSFNTSWNSVASVRKSNVSTRPRIVGKEKLV